MKILFLTDNYPPEVNAPATRTHSHCVEWVRAGADVTVLTCVPNFPRGRPYPGYVNRPLQTEWIDGVRVIRVWSFMAPNQGFLKRILDFLSYAVMATLVGVFQRFDVLVATSPQLFTAVAGCAVAGLRRKPWVFELRDLWPESIVALGAMKRGFVIQALERMELALYRSADLVVSVSEAFVENLVTRGIDAGKIIVVPNGVDRATFSSGRGSRTPVGRRSRPFRVGYLGTLGMAHGLDLVLRAAALADPEEVTFVLVGDGARKATITEAAAAAKLSNVEFIAPVPRSDVPGILADFDAALVPLRDLPVFRSAVPSKIFEAAGAGIPILLGVRGEAERIVLGAGAGLPFAPESEEALVDAIHRLRADPELRARLVEGCSRLATEYDRRPLAAKMLAALTALPDVLRTPLARRARVRGVVPRSEP